MIRKTIRALRLFLRAPGFLAGYVAGLRAGSKLRPQVHVELHIHVHGCVADGPIYRSGTGAIPRLPVTRKRIEA